MNQREASKQNWNSGDTREDINSGSLQRIADATELMASNYQKLLTDAQSSKEAYHKSIERERKLERRIAALKGVITRIKK